MGDDGFRCYECAWFEKHGDGKEGRCTKWSNKLRKKVTNND